MTNKSERLRGLYVITDPGLTPEDSIFDQVEAALKGGARLVQYRDKSQDKVKRQQQAATLKALCQRFDATFIVNDDVDLALEVQAHGVHLGLTDTGITEARERLGPDYIIGATCHGDIANAWRAQDESADYVAFGRFFPSATKPDAPLANLETVGPQLSTLSVPAVAIGGITLANTPQLCAAGFAMVAVVADIFAQSDITGRCRQYSQLFQENQ